MTWIIAALAGIVMVVAAAFAVVGLGVFVGIIRRGSRAADEAYRRGDSLSTYWDPSKIKPLSGPQHDARAAIAGRRHPRFGVVAVAEHASDNNFDS